VSFRTEANEIVPSIGCLKICRSRVVRLVTVSAVQNYLFQTKTPWTSEFCGSKRNFCGSNMSWPQPVLFLCGLSVDLLQKSLKKIFPSFTDTSAPFEWSPLLQKYSNCYLGSSLSVRWHSVLKCVISLRNITVKCILRHFIYYCACVDTVDNSVKTGHKINVDYKTQQRQNNDANTALNKHDEQAANKWQFDKYFFCRLTKGL